MTMSMGRGMFHCVSTKQKLKTRSLTEAELVVVDDGLPNVLWTANFIRAQGYEPTKVRIMQDNQSAIMMETRGKASSSCRTRHLDIRYFFIKDVVDKGMVSLEYEPTEEMVSDYLTKPLQGALFQKF